MKSDSIDTPALLVDIARVRENIAFMQKKADAAGVNLRPHTKTHRTPALAAMQVAAGASGITVAKIGEAEVMLDAGLDDIFITCVLMGEEKMRRLRACTERGKLRAGVDSPEQVAAISSAFLGADSPLELMIEVETGELRTGVLSPEEAVSLARFIANSPGVRLAGVFSHEGHSYGAPGVEACRELSGRSQRETVAAANHIRKAGMAVDVVSTGATPSLLLGGIEPGVTEIRPGTYILMDAAQGAALGNYDRCAATILATVISKRPPARVVLDAGVKALTAFVRPKGICATPGFGIILKDGKPAMHLEKLYDEHGVINGRAAFDTLTLGRKVRIVPNHICPACNLYDTMVIVEGDEVIDTFPISCRGKSQ
jgi:D-serine deaminase-like pyridoxal phosphate-dependent protein